MSQQRAADGAGVRREMWAKYEAGAEPGADVLANMGRTGINVDFVLTGITEEEALRQREALHAAAGVPKAQREAQRAEAELLSNYRACPPDIQDALRKMAASAAQKKA